MDALSCITLLGDNGGETREKYVQTYLETASSQPQLNNGIISSPNTVSSKSLNSFQNNCIQHFNN